MCNETIEELNEEKIEKLAALEHKQWMHWASALIKNKEVNEEKIRQWEMYMIPYTQLPEHIKELDRKWARRALDIMTFPPMSLRYTGDDCENYN